MVTADRTGGKGDLYRLEAVCRRIDSFAEPEVGRGERSRAINRDLELPVRPARLIVDRGHVERVAVRRRVGVRPPPAVPPSSCTWKVKLAYGVPLALAAGRKTSLPVAMSLTEIGWPGPRRRR